MADKKGSPKLDPQVAQLRAVLEGPCKSEFAEFTRVVNGDPAYPVFDLTSLAAAQASLGLADCQQANGVTPNKQLQEMAEPARKAARPASPGSTP